MVYVDGRPHHDVYRRPVAVSLRERRARRRDADVRFANVAGDVPGAGAPTTAPIAGPPAVAAADGAVAKAPQKFLSPAQPAGAGSTTRRVVRLRARRRSASTTCTGSWSSTAPSRAARPSSGTPRTGAAASRSPGSTSRRSARWTRERSTRASPSSNDAALLPARREGLQRHELVALRPDGVDDPLQALAFSPGRSISCGCQKNEAQPSRTTSAKRRAPTRRCRRPERPRRPIRAWARSRGSPARRIGRNDP